MKIVGYTDRLTVQPGEIIKFMVSCEEKSYRADIVQLIHGDDDPEGPGFKEQAARTPVSGTYRGRPQRPYRGSYAEVPDHPVLACQGGFTIAAWLQPTTPLKGVQGLVTRWSAERGGYGLFIDEDGSLAVWVGKGKETRKLRTGAAMRRPTWYFVAATYDAATGKAALYQEPQSTFPMDDSRASKKGTLGTGAPGDAAGPLLMAAYATAKKPGVAGYFNGKLEAPMLFGRALAPAEIEALRKGAAPQNVGGGADSVEHPRPGRDLIGAWEFSAGISSIRIADTAPHRLRRHIADLRQQVLQPLILRIESYCLPICRGEKPPIELVNEKQALPVGTLRDVVYKSWIEDFAPLRREWHGKPGESLTNTKREPRDQSIGRLNEALRNHAQESHLGDLLSRYSKAETALKHFQDSCADYARSSISTLSDELQVPIVTSVGDTAGGIFRTLGLFLLESHLGISQDTVYLDDKGSPWYKACLSDGIHHKAFGTVEQMNRCKELIQGELDRKETSEQLSAQAKQVANQFAKVLEELKVAAARARLPGRCDYV